MKRSGKFIFFGIFLIVVRAFAGKAQMKIYHINVGQGETALLEFKTAAVLVKAGRSRTNAVKAIFLII